METITNDKCPYCGDTSFTELIHTDGFGFTSTSKRCAKCKNLYIESKVIYDEKFNFKSNYDEKGYVKEYFKELIKYDNEKGDNRIMKTPQQWYVESLTEILKNKKDYIGNFAKDEAYKYVLKSFMDKYSNTFMWKKGEKINYKKKANYDILNMYWESFIPGHYDIIYKTIITSKDAYDFLNADVLSSKKAIKSKLHLEHLSPMSYTRNKLLSLNQYTVDNVKDCFKYAVVALITKEQSGKLDSKNDDAKLKDSDVQELKKLYENHKDIIQYSEIIESEKLLGKKCSLKNNGNGLLRLIHLYNQDVKFVDGNGNIIKSLEELFTMLINNKFEVLQYN